MPLVHWMAYLLFYCLASLISCVSLNFISLTSIKKQHAAEVSKKQIRFYILAFYFWAMFSDICFVQIYVT